MATNALGLTLVGAGRMGGALLRRWLDAPELLDPKRLTVIDPQPAAGLADIVRQKGGRIVDMAPADARADAVVVAVKPQMLEAALRPLSGSEHAGSLVLSIVAGVSLHGLERLSPDGAGIVRAMPNTPAQIGAGIAALAANGRASEPQRQIAERLLAEAGKVVWLSDEAHMDAVTAVSGSGPAYVFLLAECLEAAAASAGLPADLAKTLARETVVGAGALMAVSEDDVETLRRNVTSPGGTTEAALNELVADGGMGALLRRAVAEAKKRAAELGR